MQRKTLLLNFMLFLAEALKEYADNPYKTELIENLNDGEITFCSHDDLQIYVEVGI